MASITVKINGVVVAHTARPGLKIADARGRTTKCVFGVIVAGGSRPYGRGDMVEVLDTGVTVFKGTILKTQEQAAEPSEKQLVTKIDAEGLNAQFNRGRVQERYTSTTAGAIIKDIVDRYSFSGITYTAVQDGPILDEVIINGLTPRQSFDLVEERAAGYVWSISAAGDISFDLGSNKAAAAFNLTDSGPNRPYINLRVDVSPGRYFNRVKVFGGDGTTSGTKVRVTQDAADDQWKIKHRIFAGGTDAILDIGDSSTYDLKESGKEVLQDADGDFQFRKGAQIASRVVSLNSSGTRTLEFTINGAHQIVYEYKDRVEVDTRGDYEAPSIVDYTVTTIPDAAGKARALLNKHSKFTAEKVSFTTYTAGLVSGASMTMTLADRNLSGSYIIDSVTFNDLEGTTFRYTVKAVAGELLEQASTGIQRALKATSNKESLDTEGLLQIVSSETEVISATYANTMVEV